MKYYLLEGDKQVGPYLPAQLVKMFESGILTADRYVWREGLDQWVTIGDLFDETGELGIARSANASLAKLATNRASENESSKSSSPTKHSESAPSTLAKFRSIRIKKFAILGTIGGLLSIIISYILTPVGTHLSFAGSVSGLKASAKQDMLSFQSGKSKSDLESSIRQDMSVAKVLVIIGSIIKFVGWFLSIIGPILLFSGLIGLLLFSIAKSET